MGALASQVHKQRVKSLVDNENFIKKGFASDDEDDDDENIDGGVEEEAKSKLISTGKPAGGDSDEDSYDDENDPDYEETAGEFALYDSPLEFIDELIYIKETLDAIYQAD